MGTALVPMNLVHPQAAWAQMCLVCAEGWDVSHSWIMDSVLFASFPAPCELLSPHFCWHESPPMGEQAQADVCVRGKLLDGSDCCLARLSCRRLHQRDVTCSRDAGETD